MDKSSHEERLQYVKNNIYAFIECADFPLSGTVSSISIVIFKTDVDLALVDGKRGSLAVFGCMY